MNKHYYIKVNNLAPKLPLGSAFFMATSLKVFSAPGWLWGVFGVLYALLLLEELYRAIAYKPIDIDELVEGRNR